MASDPVVRSVRVSGSCSEWIPVVRDSLLSHGYVVSSGSGSSHLEGSSGDAFVAVSLAPLDHETEISVSVSANVDKVDKSVDKEATLWSAF